MPTYQVTLADGHTYQVDSPTELSDAQVYEHATTGAGGGPSSDAVPGQSSPVATGAKIAAGGLLSQIGKLEGPIEELATRPGATEGLVNKGGVALGLGTAAYDLSQGHYWDAAKHATEGAVPAVVTRALKIPALQQILDQVGILSPAQKLTQLLGRAAPAVGAIGEVATPLGWLYAGAQGAKAIGDRYPHPEAAQPNIEQQLLLRMMQTGKAE